MKTQLGLLVAAVAVLGAGCNESEQGAYDNVLFTPDDCGRVGAGCDFDDGIGSGGKVAVQIQGIDGFSTAGVDLSSGTPDVLVVDRAADIGGAPAWELTGLTPGRARLQAIQDGAEVDFLTVEVVGLTGLGLSHVLGDAAGGGAEGEFDAVYTITADQPVSFQAEPLGDGRLPTMGRFPYTIAVDDTLAVLDGSEPDSGYLYFTAPAGDHDVTFSIADEPALTVRALFHAEAGPPP
jgi:hypothetical protein